MSSVAVEEKLLTGLIAMILLIAVPGTLISSRLLLWRYRVAVARHMQRRGEAAAVASAAASGRTKRRAFQAADLERRMRTQPWALATRYAVAGLCAAAANVLTLFVLEDVELLPLRTLSVFVVSAWPVVLTTILIAAASKRQKRRIVRGYWLAFAGVSAWVVIVSSTTHWYDPPLVWLIRNLLPSLGAWLTLQRRIRAIGPLVLSILVCALFGANAGVDYLDLNTRAIVELGLGLGMGAGAILASVALIGFVSFALLAFLGLMGIGKLYRKKWVSDLTLSLDGIWLLFVLANAISTTFSKGYVGFALGLLPFVAYRIALSLLLLQARAARPENPAPRLLLLRVFALGPRTDRLWDLLAKTYRHVGSVRMIAGPDLAASSIEPHELFAFLTGRLSTHFVSDARSFEAALAHVDDRPDPDGRYRVNDFFCRDDTWQPMFHALLADSDAVLMDVRSLTPRNAGTRFELEQLAQKADPARVVLLVDDTTDMQLLEQLLAGGADRATFAPALLRASSEMEDGFAHTLARALAATDERDTPRRSAA